MRSRTRASFPTLLRSIWLGAAVIAATTLSAGESLPSLTLARTITFSELNPGSDHTSSALKTSPADEPYPPYLCLRYGFIVGGRSLYLGSGRVLDLDTMKMEERFSNDISYEYISKDGRMLYATRANTDSSDISFAWDTITNQPIKTKEKIDTESAAIAVHPDGITYAQGFLGVSHELEDIAIINTITGAIAGPSSKYPKSERHVKSITQFSDDGRYLIVDHTNLIDVHTFKWISNPEFQTNKKPWETPDPNYIGDSDVFVFNRDANWVAGIRLVYDGFVFVWDRVHKKYVWKNTTADTPSAFSPNDKYLLCKGLIVHADTGETAFNDLKGTQGKFSPDGRSLVTVDDKAFYIYTLPKNSEPIFGVFQKPEPWSPPAAKKLLKTSAKKTPKKP